MDFMSLFDTDNLEEVEKEEKKKEKIKKKAPPKKRGSNNGKHKLPVELSAGNIHLYITAENETEQEITVDLIKKKLSEKYSEFEGVLCKFFSILGKETNEKDKKAATHLSFEPIYTAVQDLEKVTFPTQIKAGKECIEVKSLCNLNEITEIWVEAHPEYGKDCKFHYSEQNNILIPFVINIEEEMVAGKKYELPVTVGYLNKIEIFNENDFTEKPDINAIRKKYSEMYPEFNNADFKFDDTTNVLFPIIKDTQEKNIKTNNKIALPVDVRSNGVLLTVTQDDIGKDWALKEEIRVCLEQIYPEYSKERTKLQYDEKNHFVVANCSGQKLGIKISSPRINHNLFFAVDRQGIPMRIEQMPFGQFIIEVDTNSSYIEVHLNKYPVPLNILKEIFIFCKKKPTHEAAMQLFLDVKTNNYVLKIPDQIATPSSVICNPLSSSDNMVLFMEVHSHGQYKAYFSETDNDSQKGICLYMVIGNCDKTVFTYKLRAGIIGKYIDLNLSDVFDTQYKEEEK